MSYQVIARKWRPQTFEEVTGQEHVTRTLRNAIEHDRLHHAYLFSGARGVGKTTTARLLAKALNCHKSDKPTSTPCRFGDKDACVSCTEIAEGRSLDVLEIDAASHTGIDDVRETILEGINISAARDRYKVFIIDEVHQLSKPAFNALLKTLEEPPSNVAFIMATTELHKVPDTILSRTQQFEFRTIPLQKIFDRLKLIAESEKVDISEEALREIARSGDGSMRDAQSNFDQVISFTSGKIDVADVVDALGLASADMLKRILQSLVDKDTKEPLAVVEEITSRGQDLRNFCRDMLGIFRDLLVAKVGGPNTASESSTLTKEELLAQVDNFSESDLVRFFNSLAETESKLRDAAQPRYMLEIGLVKLIEMRRLSAVEDVLARLASLETSFPSGAAASKAAATSESTIADASAEKKTLNNTPTPVEPEFPPPIDYDEPVESIPVPDVPEHKPILSEEFFKSLPVRLPPIPSEDLEHIEDPWLDDAYELKLARSGDKLSPLTMAEDLVRMLIGHSGNGNGHDHSENEAGSATVKTSIEIPNIDTILPPEKVLTELPILSDSPSKQELMDFANAHPKIRQVMRVFRGRIVDVRKSD
jgi:DNA polymerase-3 subunit gamma/tau